MLNMAPPCPVAIRNGDESADSDVAERAEQRVRMGQHTGSASWLR